MTPQRQKPLKRSTKRIPSRRKDASKRRWSWKRNMAYQAFVRQQRCVLANAAGHTCWGNIEACHVKSRSTGGDDVGNCYPACSRAHRSQHLIGMDSFQKMFSLDLASVAARLATQYATLEEM